MSKYISVNILFIVIISATISCADDIPATTEDGRGVISMMMGPGVLIIMQNLLN